MGYKNWDYEVGDFCYTYIDDVNEVSDDLIYKEIGFTQFMINALETEQTKLALTKPDNETRMNCIELAFIASKLKNLRYYLAELQHHVSMREIDFHHTRIVDEDGAAL